MSFEVRPIEIFPDQNTRSYSRPNGSGEWITLAAKTHLICKLFIVAALFCGVLISPHFVLAQAVRSDVRSGIVSDWTHHHVLYPYSRKAAANARIQSDPRWLHNWYIRHPDAWWQHGPRRFRPPIQRSHRDWSVQLGTVNFEPLYDGSFSFAIGSNTGYGSLSGIDQGNGSFLATAGTLTVTGTDDGNNLGAYSLVPGGPGVDLSPNGGYNYNNLIYPAPSDPFLDQYGPVFINSGGFEINIWGNYADNYSFYGSTASAGQSYIYQDSGAPFTLTTNGSPDPGGGQTSPAKYVFDVTAVPSCTNDFVVMGLPTSPLAGRQANIIGLNNLYSPTTCGAAPTVMFAYASGSGQVPAAVSISLDGTQITYIENLPPSSYFHVLTIGTTGNNGTSATSAAVPGVGNNAVDSRVLLSPDGGATTQSSTTSAFIDYAHGVAYATTYSTDGSGSGYLYKISNVFSGSGTPTIAWSVPISAVPSSPVYDSVSNKIFFTDSNGRIDYVADTGASPSVVYGAVVASGATSENPVVIDGTNQMVYATFNSNGTDAIVVQAPTSLASAVSVSVGTGSTTQTGPYTPDFNNDWYAGAGTPLMYVAGTGSGTRPTLYSIGFNGTGVMNSSPSASTALSTGPADSSPVTEFYNDVLHKDYIFVGVTNNCIATVGGGTGGCVMSLDITNGFPTVNANSTALAAPGGTTGIIVDNDSSLTQASNIYYATKTGATLVKATQSGLN